MIENVSYGISKEPEIEVSEYGRITATAGSKSATKQLPTLIEQIWTPTTEDQVIDSGVYLGGAQTIKGDPNLIAANIISGKSIFGISGSAVTNVETTPTIAVSTGGLITATAGSKSATKQLSSIAKQTLTPTTTNQYLYSGNYLTGTQTIKGDPNLIAANIISGKSIFGVNGSATVYKECTVDTYAGDFSNTLEFYTTESFDNVRSISIILDATPTTSSEIFSWVRTDETSFIAYHNGSGIFSICTYGTSIDEYMKLSLSNGNYFTLTPMYHVFNKAYVYTIKVIGY